MLSADTANIKHASIAIVIADDDDDDSSAIILLIPLSLVLKYLLMLAYRSMTLADSSRENR